MIYKLKIPGYAACHVFTGETEKYAAKCGNLKYFNIFVQV
jgi:hypothetical protein